MKGSALLPVVVAWITPFLVFTLIIVATGVQWVAWSPPILWADHYRVGNSPLAENGAAAVAADNGSLYAAGYLNLTYVYYDSSGTVVPGLLASLFLAKYDLAGHVIWTSTAGINENYSYFPPTPIAGLAPWSDGVYVAANLNGSSFIMKYDSVGHRVWASRFGGSGSILTGISTTAAGIYVIDTSFSIAHGGSLLEYDFNGNLVWNDTVNSVVGISASPLGIYVLTEDHLLRYDSNGNQVLTWPVNCGRCLYGESLSEDNSGIYVSDGRGHVWKYAPDGSLLWDAKVQLPANAGLTEGASMSADSSGVYLYVEPYFGTSCFLVKYDSNGRQLWSSGVPCQGSGWDRDPPYLSAGGGGVYLASSQSDAIVGEFGPPSLIFLGINPPWSFVTLGASAATIATGLTLTIRRSMKKMRTHPRKVRPPGASRIPAD